MLMRYAMMVAVAATAVWGAVNLGTTNAGLYLVAAGHTGSVGQSRFAIFGLPSMMDGWFQQNKSWLYTVVIGGAIYGVFYLM
jgi:hypothetical protein